MVEFGSEYQMDTGERVRAGATWVYDTPQGPQEMVFLMLIAPHTFVGKYTNDDGVERPTITALRRGTVYSLTPAELARNGKRIDAVERIAA